MNIRVATIDDHKALCKISRSHRAGQGFTNGLMFSGEFHYAKGWLRAIAKVDEKDVAPPGYPLPPGQVAGFTCFRQKSRTPETKLYYVLIDPACRRMGLGQLMLDDLISISQTYLALDCLKDNVEALAFYEKNGFQIVGESLKGKGYKLSKKVK